MLLVGVKVAPSCHGLVAIFRVEITFLTQDRLDTNDFIQDWCRLKFSSNRGCELAWFAHSQCLKRKTKILLATARVEPAVADFRKGER